MFRIKEILSKTEIDGKPGTVVSLAKKIGLPQPNLSKIVNNKANPSWVTLHKIADVLNVDIVDLFERENIAGFIKFNSHIYEINSVSDLKNLLKEIELSGK